MSQTSPRASEVHLDDLRPGQRLDEAIEGVFYDQGEMTSWDGTSLGWRRWRPSGGEAAVTGECC